MKPWQAFQAEEQERARLCTELNRTLARRRRRQMSDGVLAFLAAVGGAVGVWLLLAA